MVQLNSPVRGVSPQEVDDLQNGRGASYARMAELNSYPFKVEDMSCGGCAASIRNAVLHVPGVRAIDADPQSKDVVVDAPSDVTREAIVAAIQQAGYTEITVLDQSQSAEVANAS
jgi:copper chaperone CopZ